MVTCALSLKRRPFGSQTISEPLEWFWILPSINLPCSVYIPNISDWPRNGVDVSRQQNQHCRKVSLKLCKHNRRISDSSLLIKGDDEILLETWMYFKKLRSRKLRKSATMCCGYYGYRVKFQYKASRFESEWLPLFDEDRSQHRDYLPLYLSGVVHRNQSCWTYRLWVGVYWTDELSSKELSFTFHYI